MAFSRNVAFVASAFALFTSSVTPTTDFGTPNTERISSLTFRLCSKKSASFWLVLIICGLKPLDIKPTEWALLLPLKLLSHSFLSLSAISLVILASVEKIMLGRALLKKKFLFHSAENISRSIARAAASTLPLPLYGLMGLGNLK